MHSHSHLFLHLLILIDRRAHKPYRSTSNPIITCRQRRAIIIFSAVHALLDRRRNVVGPLGAILVERSTEHLLQRTARRFAQPNDQRHQRYRQRAERRQRAHRGRDDAAEQHNAERTEHKPDGTHEHQGNGSWHHGGQQGDGSIVGVVFMRSVVIVVVVVVVFVFMMFVLVMMMIGTRRWTRAGRMQNIIVHGERCRCRWPGGGHHIRGHIDVMPGSRMMMMMAVTGGDVVRHERLVEGGIVRGIVQARLSDGIGEII